MAAVSSYFKPTVFDRMEYIEDVLLPASKEVVESTDYETFNKEIAPYVDSLEIMMFQ